MRLTMLTALLLVSGGLTGCPEWKCDETTCADGCCQRDGTCAVGGMLDRCGLAGQACAVCSNAQTCTAGVCTAKCDAKSCPGGCCDPVTFACVLPSNQSSKACGLPGGTCATCAANQSCGSSGCVAKCTPNNCGAGCCMSNGTCLTFSSQGIFNCGKGGQACSSCSNAANACTVGECCIAENGTCTATTRCCQPTSCVLPYQGATSGSCL